MQSSFFIKWEKLSEFWIGSAKGHVSYLMTLCDEKLKRNAEPKLEPKIKPLVMNSDSFLHQASSLVTFPTDALDKILSFWRRKFEFPELLHRPLKMNSFQKHLNEWCLINSCLFSPLYLLGRRCNRICLQSLTGAAAALAAAAKSKTNKTGINAKFSFLPCSRWQL